MGSSVEEHKADLERLAGFLTSKANDRTLAIVAACYVDKYLGELIKSALPGLNYDLRKKMFDQDGLLGPIAAKIDLAKALGIIDLELQNWCKIVARIRNRFAHNLAIDDFSHPEVSDLVNKMHVPEIYFSRDSDEERKRKHATLKQKTGRDRFELLTLVVAAFIGNMVVPEPDADHGQKD